MAGKGKLGVSVLGRIHIGTGLDERVGTDCGGLEASHAILEPRKKLNRVNTSLSSDGMLWYILVSCFINVVQGLLSLGECQNRILPESIQGSINASATEKHNSCIV